VPPAAGERALFIPQAMFAAQMDVLARDTDVAPLATLDEEGDGRPRIAITFDDAYHGAMTAAVDELVTRRLPATVFVAPGRLDGHVFWWDALAGASGELDSTMRRHALESLNGDDARVRSWAAANRVAANDELPLYARAATTAALTDAAARPGITFGSHSWSHPALPTLDSAQLTDELARSRQWLIEHFPQRSVDWLAYPYGLESAMVRQAAQDAGYAAAALIGGGWHRPADVQPHARPRLSVSAGRSLAGFRARVLGSIPT
jgi:peptidoglycan/xylan/chitin deacetylase (PgdA/CDA1 family)